MLLFAAFHNADATTIVAHLVLSFRCTHAHSVDSMRHQQKHEFTINFPLLHKMVAGLVAQPRPLFFPSWTPKMQILCWLCRMQTCNAFEWFYISSTPRNAKPKSDKHCRKNVLYFCNSQIQSMEYLLGAMFFSVFLSLLSNILLLGHFA